MLVLSRKPGEAVVIGGNIEVTVLEVHGDRVKLGLCGKCHPPREVPENASGCRRVSEMLRAERRGCRERDHS